MSQNHWLPDDQVLQCALCNREFSSVVRKHHCRLCGDIFCETCSARKLNVAELNLIDQRGCITCYDYVTNSKPFLHKEAKFTRYDIDGQTTDVWIRIKENEKFLTIRYDNKQKPNTELAFAGFNQLVEGQNTSNWRNHNNGGMCACFLPPSDLFTLEHLCFSLCFSKESVDLKADTIQMKNQWLVAFRQFERLKQSRIAEFIDGEKDRFKHQQEAQKQKERNEKTQLITQKYQSQRDALRERYGK